MAADIIKITQEALIAALKTIPADQEVELPKFKDGSFGIPIKIEGLKKGSRYKLESGDLDTIIASVGKN